MGRILRWLIAARILIVATGDAEPLRTDKEELDADLIDDDGGGGGGHKTTPSRTTTDRYRCRCRHRYGAHGLQREDRTSSQVIQGMEGGGVGCS
jgi:hypothetical protein